MTSHAPVRPFSSRLSLFRAIGTASLIALSSISSAKELSLVSLSSTDPIIVPRDFPDPSIMRASDGYYYAFATGSGESGTPFHLQVTRSLDLKTWTPSWEALPNVPAWAANPGAFWAPDANEINGHYYMFYSAQPVWSQYENMRMGVAVSDRPEGPYVDSGSIFDTGSIQENIDPAFFHDPQSGRNFLYWGRNGVAAVQELSPDLLSFAAGSTATEVLRGRPGFDYEGFVEAPYVYYKDGYYYLFSSGDNCCKTAKYAVLVARSRSPLGPFERAAQPLVIRRGSLIGTGGASLFDDERGRTWITYHAAFEANVNPNSDDGFQRVMVLDRIEFMNGWPVLVSHD